ncbi:MAG: hypothetical protein RLW87_14260 [Alphaproteobacteria bacterium]|jgi:hypothetical protein|uniref:hypothetical protein n=1 Tax=Pacificispira sp. TaxID=2888761 RepID=UPI002E9976F0|nr:hypothetical protein [Pseudomonadota bacterium]
MFLTPYHTLSEIPGSHALRSRNEATAFAFWQSLNSTQDRFASLLRWGRPDSARTLEGRWLEAS